MIKFLLAVYFLPFTIAFAGFDDDLAKSITENSYGIQATCASSGQFTAMALEQTRNIRGVITSLKDKPACKGLGHTLDDSVTKLTQDLQTMQNLNALLQQSSPQAESFKSVGQEMQALRSFSNSLPVNSMNAPQADVPGFLPSSILSALNRSAMKMNRLQVVANGAKDIEPNPTRNLTRDVAAMILNYKRQLKITAQSSINTINTSMDSLNKSSEACLDSTSSAFLASGFTQMLAAFITGSEVSLIGQNSANAINKIVNFVSRDKKYIDALRSLHEVEFYNTLSCLVEMTSKGYCDVEDAQMLLSEVKKDFNFVQKQEEVEPTIGDIKNSATPIKRKYVEAEVKNFKSLLSNGPMAGHYLLAHQLPIITEWINKIQFGVQPQTKNEADFQVDTFRTGYQPFIQMKLLLGQYNAKMSQLSKTSSLAAKQNMVLDMLNLIYSGFIEGQANTENFFTRVHSAPRMPFVLIGMSYNEMPKEVFVAANNTLLDPMSYIIANYQTNMQQFKNPENLARVIKANAELIFEEADKLAYQYFLSFFIPDETAVVSESMVGMNKGDVRSALKNIDIYVQDFIQRMTKKGGDPSILPLAETLRYRLGIILAHYERIHKYGMELVELKKQNRIAEPEMQEKVTKMAKEFIQDVYDQFYIKTMRAGWLANRLMLIVKKDYSMSMQKRDFTNEQLQDLLLATGLESLNQLFNQAGIDFGTSESDMAKAREIYWKNILALEKVSAVPMQNYINESRLRADPNTLTQLDLWKEANKYTYYRHAEKVPGDNSNYGWLRSLIGGANNIVEGLFGGFGLIGKDVKYGWPKGVQEVLSTKLPDLTDSEDGASQRVWATNCAVALAFSDLRPYMYLCKNATLYSPFYNKEKYKDRPEVLAFLENELSTKFLKVAYSHLDPKVNYTLAKNKLEAKTLINKNRRTRICAVRDYYRKNYVMQITAGLNRDNEVYKSEYTKLPPPPPTPPASQEVPAPAAGSSGQATPPGTGALPDMGAKQTPDDGKTGGGAPRVEDPNFDGFKK